MNLADVINHEFHHLDANISISKARNLLREIDDNTRVILFDEEKNQYFLESGYQFSEMIKNLKGQAKLQRVLPAFHLAPIPAFDIESPISDVPEKAIIISAGKIMGYFDSQILPDTRTRSITPQTRGFNSGLEAYGAATGKKDVVEKVSSANSNQSLGDKKAFFLNAHCFEKASIKEEFIVRVNLEKIISGAASLPLVLQLNTELDVVVEAKNRFEIVGRSQNTIKVTDEDESNSIIFKFKPVELGQGRLRVMAFTDGTEIGHVDLNIEIVEESTDGRAMDQKSGEMKMEGSSLPDLRLLITESENNGRTTLQFKLTASNQANIGKLYLKPFGSITLRTDPAKRFQEIFGEIENLDGTADESIRLRMLETKGLELFKELFPEEVRKLIWSVRDKIKTLNIDSDEPWIPWEICRLTGEENGQIQEGPFLCEAFEITRWIPGHGAPLNELNLSKMAIVIPNDSGLSYAPKEKQEIEQLLGKAVEEVPSRFNALKDAFSTSKYTAWHFSGHGGFMDVDDPDNSKLLLENHEQISPSFINGKTENMGLSNPIVFFNACQVGKSAMGLTGIGGWAPQFLSVGAAAFIGAYWSISDDLAYQFAVEMYKELLNGATIGEAVRKARIAIKEEGDATWLAYTVFADPFARVKK